jgi:PAS domain S-box-containing protein
MLPKPAHLPARLFVHELHPILAAALLLLAGLALSYRLALLQHRNDIDRMRDQVTSELDKVRGDLSRELFASINLTQGLVSLVTIQGEISHQQFEAIAGELMSHAHNIRNIALAPDNVIRFIYPHQGNEEALGLDNLKTTEQRETVLRAISEKRMIVADPVKLVQGGTGIIGRTPIYLRESSTNVGSTRYWGISATVIDFDTLIQDARLDRAAQLRFALRGKDGKGSSGEIFWGDAGIFRSDPVMMDVALPSGSWQIAAIPASGWPAFRLYATSPFLLGLTISVFLALLTYLLIQMNQARGLEVAERQRVQAALRQTNRALRLFSQCNSAVVRATEEEALLVEICRIAVESAGYRMAWVGRAEQDEAKTVRPVAFAGPGEGFLDRIQVSWADDPYGRGAAGAAIRTGKPSIARDLLNNPNFAESRNVLMTRDFAAAIAVPLKVDDRVFGVLDIYAAEADAFDTTEVDLLDEMGRNISHGMSALRAQKERAAAMAALERARNELEDRVEERTRELSVKNAERLEEIERRRRVENTLNESKEKYRELVENANSIILRMDVTGRVTFFNEFAQKFFGYTEQEIIGRNVNGTIVPETDSNGRDLFQLMEDVRKNPNLYTKYENDNMKKGGERVWIAWTNKPIFDSGGRIAEVLCIGNDISNLKKTEGELVRAKEAAESADRIKSAFLATMSHELRTPLNSIIGFTGILLQGLAGPLNVEQRKQLGIVKNGAHQLLALINDVLDISKIEAGQLEVRSVWRASRAQAARSPLAFLCLEVRMSNTILVIEDNKQNLYLLRFLLESSGFSVAEAQDGREGIQAAILLDIQLPVMNGYAVAEEIRRHEALKTVPIIVVTSYAMAGDREQALAAGATDYIEKPIDPDTFVERIRKHVSP